MATIEFTTHDDDAYLRVRDLVSDGLRDTMSPGELDSGYRSHHPGAADRLQLFEVDAPANATFNAHSHTEDEIILVVDGELRAGSHVVGPGGSMYVPGGTVYSFRAGPDGLRFFNFRPRLDATYLSARETLDAREQPR